MPDLPASLPEPRTPDPRGAPPLRWGVIAPGGIARNFASVAHEHTASRVVAVGSRSAERAAAFASDFGIDRSYGSYEQLVGDADVQAVYVASPHSEHAAHALLAIQAGKPVLIEKAFTQNATQARQVADAAAARGVALMEAMWSRFLPHYDVIRQLLADGTLGEVTTLTADHGQALDDDPQSRLLNPDLAGGALLDLGIYPISFAFFALGAPSAVAATGVKARTGVDGQVSAVFSYAGQAQALVNTTLFAKTPTVASISGTAARLEIPGDFYMPQPVTVISKDGEQRRWDGNSMQRHAGFAYEIAEFARVVTDGRPESELMPVAETIRILETLDEIRRQIGVRLPGE